MDLLYNVSQWETYRRAHLQTSRWVSVCSRRATSSTRSSKRICVVIFGVPEILDRGRNRRLGLRCVGTHRKHHLDRTSGVVSISPRSLCTFICHFTVSQKDQIVVLLYSEAPGPDRLHDDRVCLTLPSVTSVFWIEVVVILLGTFTSATNRVTNLA